MSVPVLERDGSEFTEYPGFTIEYRASSHRYWLHKDGQRTAAISVTSALKILDKPALVSWSERCGVEGALKLERAGELQGVPINEATGLVRLHKLGADSKRQDGADRGTAVHDALRAYCEFGTVPKVADYDLSVRGYVQAICRWLIEASPEPVLTETVVGHPTHGYAGRLDLIAMIDGRRVLADLKTNPAGRVYDEAHVQTAAYALALEPCGIAPVDGVLIVAAGAEGAFEQVAGEGSPEDFLAVLECQRRMGRLRAARTARARAAGKIIAAKREAA